MTEPICDDEFRLLWNRYDFRQQQDLIMGRITQRELGAIRARLDAVEAERDEIQAVFDKMWEVDLRAIKAWQEAHPGNELVWPDRGKHATWLMPQLEDCKRQARIANDQLEYVNKSRDTWIREHKRIRAALSELVHACENHNAFEDYNLAGEIDTKKARQALETDV